MRALNALNAVKAATFAALLAAMPAFAVKYVAVVETEIDMEPGEAASLKRSEVRLITDEFRIAAVKVLPQSQYSVMTTETVMSQSGSVLNECAEENCIITLGGKIGADYIVRGKLSKFGTLFSLSVSMFDTEDGFLVGTSAAVRSERFVDLLEKAAGACEEMFKKFVGEQGSERISASAPVPSPIVTAYRPVAPVLKRKFVPEWYFAPKYQLPVGTPVSWGGVNAEVGMIWGKWAFLGLDASFGISGKFDGYYHEAAGGIGLSLGNVYGLGNHAQFVYGLSVGAWKMDRHAGGEYNEGYSAYDFLAPFVKLRLSFFEITYRGLLGNDYEESFSWNSHQLMFGFYFATSKRKR
jgi:hypothetical protein